MDTIKQKVNDAASFYTQSFLGLDYQLAGYSYQTLKPFFKGNVALEMGPALGYMTKELINDFTTLHLVEGSEALLKSIPDYPNVTKYHSLFEEFNNSIQYDTIIMSHVLEHIEHPVPLLKRIYNWLKPDGVFLVAVPNAKSIHRTVAVEMGLLANEYELNSRDHELGHFRVYDSELLFAHLVEGGFAIQQSGGYFLKPLSNGQIEKSWTPEMIQGFYKAGKHFPTLCAEIYSVCTKK